MNLKIKFFLILCFLYVSIGIIAQQKIEEVNYIGNIDYGYDLYKRINKELLYKIANNVELEVVNSKKLKNNKVIEIVKDGEFSAQFIRDEKDGPLTWKSLSKYINKPYVSNVLSDNDTVMFESFEGAKNFDQTWYPEGWSQFSLVGNVYKPEDGGTTLIWRLSQGSISGTIDGKYVMWLNQDMNNNPNAVHDEWLVSRSFIPNDYSLVDFYYFYCPLYMLVDGNISKMNFKESFKIHVSTDDGETWKTLWNLEDIVRQMTPAEMMTGSGSTIMAVWHNYRVNLSEYSGQNIRLAFQVKGKAQSVALDKIVVRNPAPKAAYIPPKGSMRWSYGEDLNFFSSGQFYLAPAYTDLKWQNVSNDETSSYKWEFENPDTLLTDYILSEDYEPEISYPYSRRKFPNLVAYNEIKSFYNSYNYSPLDVSFIQYGGNTKYLFKSTNTEFIFGAGSFDLTKGLGIGLVSSDSDSCFLFGKGSQDVWQALKLKGIVNIFDKPEHPYTFTKVWVKAFNVSCNYDSKLELIVCELDEDGIPMENSPIARSICYGSDMKMIYSDGRFNFYNIPFSFTETDETGRQKKRTLIIDKPIAVIIRGFDSEDFKSIGFAYQGAPHDNNEYHACVFLKPRNQDELFYPLQNVLSNYNISFVMTMDVNYPFLLNETGDNITFGQNGGIYDVIINTLEDFKNWDISGLPEWLTIQEVSVNNSIHKIRFTASQMINVDERDCILDISIKATSPIQINIRQDSDFTSISSTELSRITYYRNNNELIFNGCASFNYIEIYNLAGCCIYKDKINTENEYVISNGCINSGSYIVRFIGDEILTMKIIY